MYLEELDYNIAIMGEKNKQQKLSMHGNEKCLLQ